MAAGQRYKRVAELSVRRSERLEGRDRVQDLDAHLRLPAVIDDGPGKDLGEIPAHAGIAFEPVRDQSPAPDQFGAGDQEERAVTGRMR